MLKCVKRLLQHHAYEPILFSSAQAFKSHTDLDRAACIILDINLPDGSGIELRHRLMEDGVSRPGDIYDWERRPCRSRRRAGLWLHRISNQALFRAVAP